MNTKYLKKQEFIITLAENMEKTKKIVSLTVLKCRCRRLPLICLSAVSLPMFFPQMAMAYIDPGTGAYIFQILIAGLLGAVFVMKTYWHKILAIMKRLFSYKNKQDTSEK